jgi:hypothetical protein
MIKKLKEICGLWLIALYMKSRKFEHCVDLWQTGHLSHLMNAKIGEIWGSHGDEYEDGCLLECAQI